MLKSIQHEGYQMRGIKLNKTSVCTVHKFSSNKILVEIKGSLKMNERYVKDYPTIHYIRVPGHAKKIRANKIFVKYLWEIGLNDALWDVGNMT